MSVDHSQEPDPELVRYGRQYIWIAIGFLAVTSLLVSALWVWRFGLDRAYLNRLMVRWSLLALLGAMLLQGRAWARWLTVALLMYGMYTAVLLALRPDRWSRGEWPGTVFMLAMYTGYAIITHGLVYSESVRAFFRAHRRHPPSAGHGDTPPPRWRP